MRIKRVCISAIAFLLIAAMSVTAFAEDYEVPPMGNVLRSALEGSQSGDTVSLTDSMDLHAIDLGDTRTTTLPAGVILKTSGSEAKTLTIQEGATFQIDLGARVSRLVNLKTDGSGAITLVTRDNGSYVAADWIEEIRYGSSKQLTTVKDGVHYFDTPDSSVAITIKAGKEFVSGIGSGSSDYPVTLFLVDETGITRDASNNITAIDMDKAHGHNSYQIEYETVDGESVPKSGTFGFTGIPSKNKTYHVMIRVGGSGGDLLETGYVLSGFNGATASATIQSINWGKLVAGHAYEAFAVTNPDNYIEEPSVDSSNLKLNSNGMLIARRPMAKTNVDVSFLFRLPNGLTRGTSATKAIEIKSPVTAPSRISVRTNQRTKVFTIDMPKSGEPEYAGYELTDVSADNANVLFNLENGEEYITAIKNFSGDVNFTFTFKDAAERSEAGTGDTLTVVHKVKVTASTPNPPHTVAVIAPKLYIAAGESVQLSVPGEKISNAFSGNLNVALATADGRVIGIAPGMATIYVNTQENGQGTIQIMVTGSNAAVYASNTVLAEDETAQIYFTNGATVTYAYSSNSRIVRVTNSGRVTAVAPGTATVYVTASNGTGGTITFTVNRKPLKIYGTSKIAVGQTAQLTLPAGEAIFSVTSSNPSVVSVHGNGFYYGAKSGTATLTVTSVTGRVGSYDVTVTGGTTGTDSRTIKVGGTTQLTVKGDSIIAAYSENTKVATVTNKGKVTGVSAGKTVIHVFTRSGSHGTVTITVTGSSSKNSSSRTMLVDQYVTLKVKGKKIVAATLEEDNGTLTVSNSGKVTALAAGEDTVLLITNDNKVYRVKFTVKARSGKISIKKNSRLRLRSKPGSGSTLAYLRNGNKVTILARSGSYYKVQVTVGNKKYTGYLARGYVKK